MSQITTHILDTSTGQPAAGVGVRLEMFLAGAWAEKGRAVTDSDGRARALLGEPLIPGTYRLRFESGAYFKSRGLDTFFPHVEVVFHITDTARHYHVPLLLSPFGYSTYRGS